jgi:hypothetical protein
MKQSAVSLPALKLIHKLTQNLSIDSMEVWESLIEGKDLRWASGSV